LTFTVDLDEARAALASQTRAAGRELAACHAGARIEQERLAGRLGACAAALHRLPAMPAMLPTPRQWWHLPVAGVVGVAVGLAGGVLLARYVDSLSAAPVR